MEPNSNWPEKIANAFKFIEKKGNYRLKVKINDEIQGGRNF